MQLSALALYFLPHDGHQRISFGCKYLLQGSEASHDLESISVNDAFEIHAGTCLILQALDEAGLQLRHEGFEP